MAGEPSRLLTSSVHTAVESLRLSQVSGRKSLTNRPGRAILGSYRREQERTMANCLVAQSGGPTAVINSSLAGVVRANQLNPL